MTDPTMVAPSRDRMETHEHAMRLIATDPAFREKVAVNDAGDSPLIVMDWDDTLGEFFAAIERVGMPSSLVVPYGDGGVWLLSLVPSMAHSKFTDAIDPAAPLRHLLAEVMQRGSVAVCPAENRPATIHLTLFREAS